MVSVERIIDYMKLETEPLNKGKITPPPNWPFHGEISFENVSLKYDQKFEKALCDINLEIRKAEKIGVVGRTGAGKTSFLQTMFRMYEPDGKIIIDGINIKELSLFHLRNSLTIIPVRNDRF